MFYAGRVSEEFLKTGKPAHLEYEAAGLRWLRDAAGAATVDVLGLDSSGLHLQRLETGFESATAAGQFGTALAKTHAAGAPGWGAAPPSWHRTVANKGAMPMSVVPAADPPSTEAFGVWLIRERLAPMVRIASDHGDLPASLRQSFEKLYRLLQNGDFDSPQPAAVTAPAARLHGDLWAGNLMWTRTGVVLIDPSAYGGHAETDLGECGLFGTPYMSEIYAGYNAVSPLAAGWEERVALHRLYMLTLHLALFGTGYLGSVAAILDRYV